MAKTRSVAAAPSGWKPTPCANTRQRILDNAAKTGKEAFPYHTMGIRMVEGALSQMG